MKFSLTTISSLAILYHFLFYISSHGLKYTVSNFLPVFGIKTKKSVFISTIISLLILSIITLFSENIVIFILLFSTFLIYMLTKGWRLSNHLVIIFVLLFSELLGKIFLEENLIGNYTKTLIYFVLISLYFSALFHKLNRDYLNPNHSFAIIFFEYYFIKVKQLLIKKIIPFLSLLIYLSIIICLINSDFIELALTLGILIHTFYGITGNPHFSVLIFLLFLGLIEINSINYNQLGAIFIMSIIISFFCLRRNYSEYANKLFTVISFSIFASLSSFIFIQTRGSNFDLTVLFLNNENFLLVFLISLFFLFNNFSPYYTLKTEFSMAMFSNLKMDNHLLIKNKKRTKCLNNQYVVISNIKNLNSILYHKNDEISRTGEILSQYRNSKYLKYFISECNKLYKKHNLNEIVITVKEETNNDLKYNKNIFLPYRIKN